MKEGSEDATKKTDGWVHCDICDYKCKKQTTFRKHTKPKHNQIKNVMSVENLLLVRIYSKITQFLIIWN